MRLTGTTEADQKLRELLSTISGSAQEAMDRARLRWAHIAKPLHSLGILEDDIVKMAGACGSDHVNIAKRALVIMCADNGIVEEGVTQTGKEVTAIVTENMTNGTSCACIMAARAGVDVIPVDIGVDAALHSGTVHPLLHRKIGFGTKNFLQEPAMTRGQALLAIETGMELTRQLAAEGYGLLATGEMGIGNTTTSSAVASLLLCRTPEELTGRGAGLSDSGLSRKVHVVKAAVERYGAECQDAVDVLAKAGGFDLAGLAGVFLGGAVYGVPVLVDGFISGTAALAAASICPEAVEYMIASHVSAEPAGSLILEALGLEPVIRAGLCLGEGTGAIAVVPLLDMALDVYNSMSTFEEISVEEYKPLSLGGKR